MRKDAIASAIENVDRYLHAGCDQQPIATLADEAETLESGKDAGAIGLAQALRKAMEAESDETPLPLLDAAEKLFALRASRNELPDIGGDLEEIDEDGFWATPMPAETLYTLVPETRPFAKRAKSPEQVEALASAARRGHAADLRMLPIYLKLLNDKAGSDLADTVAQSALPSFGRSVLNDLWPGMTPDSRHFIAAYKIDVGATLTRLLEKPAKRGDKSGSVMKAVERLMESVSGGTAKVGPESLPILKLALKFAPDPVFRRKIAELIVGIGPAAAEALPDLVDAFEHGGLTRDYQLIRLLVVMGKESQEVADALIRALNDRDASVRLLAAFNLGVMGKPALGALPVLEDLVTSDTDAKVREQAAKTVNKLRLRMAPPPTEIEGDAEAAE